MWKKQTHLIQMIELKTLIMAKEHHKFVRDIKWLNLKSIKKNNLMTNKWKITKGKTWFIQAKLEFKTEAIIQKSKVGLL